METQAEEQAVEAQKERKLRERNEQYSRQLEEELEGLKVRLQTVCSQVCCSQVILVSPKRLYLLFIAAEAGRLLHRAGLGGPDAGGGASARGPGEEDAHVRGGAGAQGDAAQRRPEGPAQRAAGCREPTPGPAEGDPDA